jgi:hypothetical protein
MNQTLVNLVLALATNEILHNLLEVQNMEHKLKRLSSYIAGETFKELRLNINTRSKSYFISIIGFIVFVLPLWLIYTWLSIAPSSALRLTAGLLIVSYIATAISVDHWHVQIEKITRPFMKKKR